MHKLLMTLGICIVLFFGCNKKDTTNLDEKKPNVEKHQKINKPNNSLISFEVLRKWTPGSKGTGMDILVSETATKEQVLKLANYLKKKHTSSGFIWISIFDLKDAWKHRDDENYPSEKYFNHFLAQISVNPSTGHNKVSWVAEGREN